MYPIFIAGALLVSNPLSYVAHSVTEIGEGTFSAQYRLTQRLGQRAIPPKSVGAARSISTFGQAAHRLKHDARLRRTHRIDLVLAT